jgi:3',5'-cyclic AMP phosphodiesterase CpdA
MLESRPSVGTAYNLSVRLVSYARVLDPRERARKLSRSLAAAVQRGATHVVISGDLTEIGSNAQFEAFAHALHDSEITPDRITLVPGNHDAYTTEDGWRRALEGPLKAFRASSAHTAGHVVERGDVVFLPIDSTCFQSIARSGGEVTEETARAIEARLADPAMRNKAVVLVQHHPPFTHSNGAWNWIDGLRGSARLMETLMRYANVQMLHGHMHRIVDRLLGKSRIFGASAVVDDGDAPRVRFYDLRDGALEAVPA